MRRRYLLQPLLLLLVFSFTTFSQSNIRTIDLQSLVVSDGSSAEQPVGYAFDNFGPYTAYERIWVFYSNGNNAVWRTREAADGAEWSDPTVIFSATNSPQFNTAFDGEYFHIIRAVDGDLRYRRGKAQPNGTIVFDPEVTAYSHATWKVRVTMFNGSPVEPRHFSIFVDSNKQPWIITKVSDGNETDSNYKPIALSSTTSDGTWVSRDGFPVDLATAYNWWANGRSVTVSELNNGIILFTWGNYRTSTLDPNRGFRARIWDNGTLGPIENTGLTWHTASTSVVVPEPWIALLNSQTEVARRNNDGTWERVDPGDMINKQWNVLTAHNGDVRLWDFNSQDLRYKQSSNNGETWGALTTKWSSPEDINQINGTHALWSQGSHHSMLWITGNSPYDIYMGIEGTIPHPDAPLLVSPVDGTADLPEDVTLIWRSVDIAHTYDVQVSTQPDFSTTVINETGVTDTTRNLTDLPLNITYYWRVRAVTEGETQSDWSEVWQFKTVGIPPAPALLSPADGAENQSTSLSFSWESSPGTERYQLQIATIQDFSATFFDQDNIIETSYTVNGLDNDRTYYWRVRAINEFGEGEWSGVWSFTTKIGVPSLPVLVTPENNAINQPITLTFEWEEADLADTYRFQVSKVSDFSSTVINVGNITETSYEVTNLEHSLNYYWRVNATNESGTSGWSSVWSFTTIIEKPAIPQLTSPADGAEGISTRPDLDWEDAARTETYQVQVATDSDFTSVVLDVEELENSSLSVVDEIDEFTTHYWRVRATNIGGTSDWSDVWQFTTDQAFPIAPALVSPEDGKTDVTDATLLWNSVPTATQYRVQISEEPDFSASIAVDRDDITNTFYTATNLEKWTTYYWRVRGISHVGEGYWSESRSFETGDIVSVEQIDNAIPTEFSLEQNYPNPFNPATTIRFGLPSEAIVYLEVYNMLGQRIATLISGEHYAAGMYEAVWDSRDDAGNPVSSGVYIYRISAGDYVNIKKMLLMK